VGGILDWSEIFGKLARFHELTDLYGRELLLAVLCAVKETLSPLFWGWLDTEVVMSRIDTILQVCSMASSHVNWVHSLHSFSADRGVRLHEHVGMTMFWKLQHDSTCALHECERVSAMKSCLQLVRTVHTLQFMNVDVEEEVVECAPFSTREMVSFAAKTLECARVDLNPDMLDLAGLVLSVLSFGSPEVDAVDAVRDSVLLLQSASDGGDGGCCASLVGGIAACLVTLTKRPRADLDGLVHKLLTIADTQLEWEWARDGGHAQAAKDVLTLARGYPSLAVSLATKVLGAAAAVQEKTCRNLVACKVAIDVVHKVFSAGDAWELSGHDGRVLIMALLKLMSLSRHVVEFLGFRCLHVFETLRLSGVLLAALCDPDVVLALTDCMVSFQPCEDARQLFHVLFPDALLLVLDGPIRQHQMVMHRLVFDALPAVAARRGLLPRQGSTVHDLVTALQPWKDMVSREWSCSRQAWCCAVVLSMRKIALTFFC